MLNPIQRICADTYAEGDFAHVETLDDAREAGDTLFTFLMIELSSPEGCDSDEEAARRLEMAIDQIRGVADAVERSASAR
ncbi:MAG TPA: hypothetical protein VF503_15040 [Sphingobium sp.]|uniref:hypothetical protein n=1 Tax=Sphingobium sp. TaxID=1912891 RepID=UPI002ED51C64